MSQTDTRLDVKQAVAIAKAYVTEAFSTESIDRVGLEEIAFDEDHAQWRITIGFARPWDKDVTLDPEWGVGGWQLRFQELLNLSKRTYKIVVISAESGEVIRVENRPV